MILQHAAQRAVPVGDSRGVAGMSVWNAVLTVVGIVGGYALGGGSITGAILGNALGNVAGCAYGWLAMERKGLDAGGPMLCIRWPSPARRRHGGDAGRRRSGLARSRGRSCS
jgi:hypothetical protein